MSAGRPIGFASRLQDLVSRLFRRRKGRGQQRADSRFARGLRFEPLECRTLLASDLAAISGLVTLGTPVAGATINLYQDDGDGLFEPGAGDALLDTTVTNGTGNYRFDRLSAANYWVEQPAQTAGSTDLGQFVSPLINISALEAQGIAGTSIDDFNNAIVQTVTANSGSPTASDAADYAGALGGERDLQAQLTSGGAGESVTIDSQSGRLLFSSTASAQGTFVATYDGDDDSGSSLTFTGLGGVDLTDSGNSIGIQARIRADQANSTLRLRIYTDGNNFSESIPFTVPGTNADTDVVFAFADFTTGVGAAGPANFTNVGAIEVTIATNVDGTDGRVTLLGAFGESFTTQDITNEADLSLTKGVSNASPNLGQNVTFTITLDNDGTAGATNIEVTDLLPAGLDFVSATPSQGSYDDATGIWTVGNVASQGSASLQIVATVTSTAALENTAEITAADQPDPDSTPDNGDAGEDDIATAQVDAPAAADLSLTKEIDDPTPALGNDVTFTITVSNAGPDQATGVVVTDQLPAGLEFVSSNPSQGTYNSATGVWTVGSVNSGGNATLEIVATVTVTAALDNVAEITAADQFDPDSTPNNHLPAEDDQDTAQADAPSTADLSVIKTVDDATPIVGEDVTFTITITNGGPDGATGVELTDLLPAGLSFVSSTPSQGTYDSGTGVWTVGAIAVNSSATLSLVATATSLGAKVNTAEITASDQPDPDSTPDNNNAGEDDQASATVTPAQIDLSLTKTVDDNTPNNNQNVVFTITVSNSGPSQATGVQVEDLLPAGLTFVSANASQGLYDSGTGVWPVGTMNSGANATLSITATVTTIGAKTNTAEITAADQGDVDSTPDNGNSEEDDQASAILTPTVADLSVAKTVNDNTPDKNQNVTFTITVTNGGPDQATNVALTDVLPAGLTFVSSTPSQGSYNSGTGVWTVGTINSGGNATLVIVATVTTSGVKTNTAQVSASDQFDPDSTPGNSNAQEDDQSSVDVTPNVADLSLTKTVNDSTPDKNQSVTFTLTVTNGGPADATGVTVNDVLPAGVTFVSSTPSQGTYNSATGVWTVGAVNNGATATLAIVATVTTSGAKTNTAEISASNQFDPDSTPANNQSSEDDQASATVTPTVADLSVTKTVNNASADLNQNVVFTVTVSNAGPDTATNVALTDILPAGLTFVSSTPSQGTYTSATGVWTVGTINSGANATLQITATVTSIGAKTNTAQVSASDQFDPDSTPGNSAAGEDDQAAATVTPPTRFSKRLFLARTPGT